MRRHHRASLAAASLAMAVLALAACVGSQVSTILETIGDGPVIAAADLAFDRDELQVPADVAFSLVFENRESAPHNVAIYTDESASEALFVGEIFGGPGSRIYQLPAIAPGTYVFRCDVHPEMRGQLTATP
jgi:plastocyanin